MNAPVLAFVDHFYDDAFSMFACGVGFFLGSICTIISETLIISAVNIMFGGVLRTLVGFPVFTQVQYNSTM